MLTADRDPDITVKSDIYCVDVLTSKGQERNMLMDCLLLNKFTMMCIYVVITPEHISLFTCIVHKGVF